VTVACTSHRWTSLRCHWQTHVTQCLRSTVLYTGVDGQCDKLVTEAVSSLPHWPSNFAKIFGLRKRESGLIIWCCLHDPAVSHISTIYLKFLCRRQSWFICSSSACALTWPSHVLSSTLFWAALLQLPNQSAC